MNEDIVSNGRDSKGRLNVRLMSDRELLEEMVSRMRNAEDTVQSYMESMQKNPMLRAFAGKFGG